jgi:hypothetical protein
MSIRSHATNTELAPLLGYVQCSDRYEMLLTSKRSNLRVLLKQEFLSNSE